MHGESIDLIFPPHLIPGLKNLRGFIWKELIDHLSDLDCLTTDRLAFILMMVNLSGCVTCQADSYKAMRGCAQCASVTIKRFRGNDQDLFIKFSESVNEIKRYGKEDRNELF